METERVAKFSLWNMSQKCYDDYKVHYKLAMGGAPQVAMRVASQIWQVVFASQTLQVFCLALRKKAQYVVVSCLVLKGIINIPLIFLQTSPKL
jgi:hypothetical protein